MKLPKQLQNKEFRFIKVADGSKMAIEKNWAKTANYPYDDKSFLSYLSNAKNYGVLCGRGNLAIIDCDTKELAETVRLKLPNTFTVKTGSGNYHFYYTVKDLDKKIVFVDKDDKHHGELQWTGFQCVGPGSLHKSGARYKPVSDKDIEEISKTQLVEALDNYVQAKDKGNEKQKKFVDNASENGLNWDIGKLIDEVNLRLEEQREKPLKENRDGELCGCHPVHGSTGKQNFHINLEKGTWHCKRHNTGGDTVALVAILEGIMDCEDNHPGYFRENKDTFKEVLKIGHEKYGYPRKNAYPETRKPSLYLPDDKKQLNIVKIGKYIKDNLIFYFIPSKGTKTAILFYKNGYYHIDTEGTVVKDAVKQYLGEKFTKSRKSEILEFLKDSVDNWKKLDDFERPPRGLINFKNGIYKIDSNKLVPHSPKYHFLYQIPYDYDPKAKCPRILQYFNNTLSPEMVKFSQEVFGYCLTTSTGIPMILYLYGLGGNGKKIWTSLLETLLGGRNNTTSFTIKQLVTSSFNSAQLWGKLANIASESGEYNTKETDMLKSISSGDPIKAEFKGVDSKTFSPFAKLIFSCNEMPSSKDRTDGWYDRQYIIPFLKRFRGTKKETINLADKLCSNKKEIQGLASWALQGLLRLCDNGGFSHPKDKERRYLEFVRNEKQFLEERLARTGDWKDYEEFNVIYSEYLKWCKKKEVPFVTKNAFGRTLTYKEMPADTKKVAGNTVKIRRYCRLEKVKN